MSFALATSAAALLLDVVPPPPPWSPEAYPEYEASCHLVDANGATRHGRLVVSGQEADRMFDLKFAEEGSFQDHFAGKSSPVPRQRGSFDGVPMYELVEFLPEYRNSHREGGKDFTSVTVVGNFPDPVNLSIQVRNSAVPPGVGSDLAAGLCRISNLKTGVRK
ncbi:hypothetical protein L7H23_00920 [Sphingopyxis sp. BSN-002]|uniref:hypothetical protein n=1 Tax=Sphingopyxis sp. BSN-002 TaxID=2911495 RepID=UPI001EDB6B71|nr:hypothetical protein [Sphingopyxis sp. BSN-002]UKK84696.1 hypothetical protein L7H23_00920 [Sphingopyxis sp. BSN-002]